MAQECGFFNAELEGSEYDRVYNAEQFAAYFASFIANGIFGDSMGELVVLENQQANMSVDVSSGQAWINGWWYRNTEELNLQIAIADGVLNRKDVVVLRWGNTERDMWLQVIQGEPSGEPITPEIRRDADYYDLKLCEISIPAGTSAITQSLITDTRLDNNVCGLVTGVVDQIDTTELFIQFQAAYADWKNTQEADFEAWFANIQDILDESTAGHLQNEINDLDTRVDGIEDDIGALKLTPIQTTTFPSDGSILVTYSVNETLRTVFNSDGSISEIYTKDGVVTEHKTIFNANGSISVVDVPQT